MTAKTIRNWIKDKDHDLVLLIFQEGCKNSQNIIRHYVSAAESLSKVSEVRFAVFNASKNSKIGMRIKSIPAVRMYAVGYDTHFDEINPTHESVTDIISFIIDHAS